MRAGNRAFQVNPLVLIGLGLLCVALAAIVIQLRSASSKPPIGPDVPEPKKLVDDPVAVSGQAPNAEVEAARARAERAEALRALQARFNEEQLKDLAQASEELEAKMRNEFGEAPELYEALAKAWAEHCAQHKITEVERDALEDEALRRGWLPDRE